MKTDDPIAKKILDRGGTIVPEPMTLANGKRNPRFEASLLDALENVDRSKERQRRINQADK